MTSSAEGSTRSRFAGWIGHLVKLGLVALLLIAIAIAAAVSVAYSSLPDFNQLKASPNGQTVRLRAADGRILVSMGPSYGKWLTASQIPSVMKTVMVAVEDRRFYSHPGVDPLGIVRGLRESYTNDNGVRGVRGVSTLTQQLARNLFLTSKRSYARKLREAILAIALEVKFSKDQILELYLNKVYFGGGAYGIDAASRKFFGHSATRLSLGEAAIIAGLVKAPSNYSPTADTEAAIGRARVVLDVMARQGLISVGQIASADPAQVNFVPEPRQNSVRYFTDWVLQMLDTLVDEQAEPIDVWTTLDLQMQAAADRAIDANTPAGAQGALVALDTDGAVRAMVGGRDYVTSIYNRATQAMRQPGSSFKLFVYLAALEAGHRPDEVMVDEEIEIDGWRPRNNSRRFSGEMTLRTAFAYSINTIAAQLGQDVGTSNVANMAHRFGISSKINTQPSMVLGTSDVRLIELTSAFASVAADGLAVRPYGINRITSGTSTVLYEHAPPAPRVLVGPDIASMMTDLLQTAVNTGTARAANIGRPVAGKTGTTSSNKDGWFLGFSSGLTTGVWMGRDDAKPIPGLQGGTAPARAFAQFMRVAVAKRPVKPFRTQVTLPEAQLEGDPDGDLGNDANAVDPDSTAQDAPAAPPSSTNETIDPPLTGDGHEPARPAGPAQPPSSETRPVADNPPQ